MRTKLPKILVTGGAGFIGSEFVRLIAPLSGRLIVVDKLTYAGNMKRLEEVKGKIKFYKTDICDKKQIELIFKREKPNVVINFAAETHVDRSIVDATPFIDTNVKGVMVLLDAARKYKLKKFIQISTDEVYGEIKKGRFTEESPLRPNSPYAASKAAADLLIKSYIRTYDFPAVIVRPCNNYGPWQYPEKLIPLAISRALKNKSVPVYAKGQNVREWLYVSDCANAIMLVVRIGKVGEVYNVGSNEEKRNIEVISKLLNILGKQQKLIEFVADRPGHDLRYSLDHSKIRKALKWHPGIAFEAGLRKTVSWYRLNIKNA